MNFPLKESRFLVTGGAGFIGSNLVEYLLNEGAFVRVVDNFSTGKRKHIEAFSTHPNIEFIEGDVRDLSICHQACQNIDYILHQAALGSVPRSIDDPIATHENNISGTLNILVAAKEADVKRVVYASSSSVYGDNETLPKVEGSEGALLSPYAVSKAACELYAANFHRVYGLQTIGLRYFNVFGKRQDPDSIYAAVIPIFVKALLQGQAPSIHGNGQQSRDFTYIDNVIQANLLSCFSDESTCGYAYNIGCAGRIYLNDLYAHIQSLLGTDITPLYSDPRPGDIMHSHADISLAKKRLGYDPKIGFQEGLDRCIEWYSQNL